MDCSKLQKDILNGITNDEMEQHLSECAECEMFQDSLEQFLTARPDIEEFNPPEKLDYEVKKEARLYIEKHMKAYNAGENLHTPIIPKLTSYFAAAACSALVAWLIIIALQPKNHDADSGNQPEKTGLNSVYNSPDQMTWESISLDEEFFNVTTDIEINHILLFSPIKEEEKEENEDKIQLPEEDNWS